MSKHRPGPGVVCKTNSGGSAKGKTIVMMDVPEGEVTRYFPGADDNLQCHLRITLLNKNLPSTG